MRCLPHADLAPGEDDRAAAAVRPMGPIAHGICYEDAYGAEQLGSLPDAGLLINVSNDAWFGDSIAPHQHLQIARMRSLEFGRRCCGNCATNTGISAHRPDGELVQSGPAVRARGHDRGGVADARQHALRRVATAGRLWCCASSACASAWVVG